MTFAPGARSGSSNWVSLSTAKNSCRASARMARQLVQLSPFDGTGSQWAFGSTGTCRGLGHVE